MELGSYFVSARTNKRHHHQSEVYPPLQHTYKSDRAGKFAQYETTTGLFSEQTTVRNPAANYLVTPSGYVTTLGVACAPTPLLEGRGRVQSIPRLQRAYSVRVCVHVTVLVKSRSVSFEHGHASHHRSLLAAEPETCSRTRTHTHMAHALCSHTHMKRGPLLLR
jgi:hypothetical protein